jgi:uncharacterized protein (TIGR00269 family)
MDLRMQCNKCRREAVIFQEYSGQHLCKQHFEADFERKAKREIRRHRWLESGDRIAVALSGDANSSALLCFLKKLTSGRRDVQISAISIAEGITGYHDPQITQEIAGMSGTECIKVSFPEMLGITVDEIACRKETTLTCTYCRVIRKYLLNKTAVEHGVTKLALGNDLDDLAASVTKNILQGNSGSLFNPDRTGSGKIPKIRPFSSIPKKEVILYAALRAGRYDTSHCPYNNRTFEHDIREMLDEFSTRHPATKYALANLKKNLAALCRDADLIPSCQQCGEPSDGLCLSCRIINEVTAHGS